MVVKMDDDAILHPTNWKEMDTLTDFNFSLDLTFGVSGKITIKAFVIGIKVSSIRYAYFEEIDIQGGIIRQKFIVGKRDYFTIEIMN